MRIFSIYVMLDDGRCIFNQQFTPEAPPKNLITGMLTAFQEFVREVVGTYPSHLAAGGMSFHFEKRGPMTVVLTTSHKEHTLEELNQLSLRFLQRFGDKIENWSGDTTFFDGFKDDVEDVLGPQKAVVRINPKKPLNAFILLDIDPELQDIAKTLIKKKEASSEQIAKELSQSEFQIRLKLEKLVKKGHVGRFERDDSYVYFTK